ncbi:MAG: response regulator transcription factor, partial [Chloroflexota bacterium]
MSELVAGDKQRDQPKAIVRVLLADDHPIVRDGIRNELARHFDIKVVGEATNGDEALRLTEELRPDVLLLDIAMPGLKVVEIMRQLQRLPSPPRILVLTAYGDEENVLGMLQAGATGYLLKDEDPAAIVEGVRAVAQGRPWLSAAVVGKLAKHVAEEETRPTAPELSARELEVLRQLARGL